MSVQTTRVVVMTFSKKDTTPIKIITQGDVKLSHDYGYGVERGENIVCFFIDPVGKAYVEGTSYSDDGNPLLYLSFGDYNGDELYTVVEFPEFKGYSVHATRGGKTISVALYKF